MNRTFRSAIAILVLGAALSTGAVGQAVARPDTISITFDDGQRPCSSSDTVALGGFYRSLGVRFSGPGDGNGGAVFDQCSNFGVTGFSPPNFLGFNTDAPLKGGGYLRAPETIEFDAPKSHVDILAGSRNTATILKLRAFDVSGAIVDEDLITLTPEMQMLSVDGAGIQVVRIVPGLVSVFVLDDLHAS